MIFCLLLTGHFTFCFLGFSTTSGVGSSTGVSTSSVGSSTTIVGVSVGSSGITICVSSTSGSTIISSSPTNSLYNLAWIADKSLTCSLTLPIILFKSFKSSINFASSNVVNKSLSCSSSTTSSITGSSTGASTTGSSVGSSCCSSFLLAFLARTE